jgi:hypothetical protein
MSGDCIADFSVGDWGKMAPNAELSYPGAPQLGPVQWTIPKPKETDFWWRPRAELTGPWRSEGSPSLGEAWYGPFDGNPMRAKDHIRMAQEDLGGQIAAGVERIMQHQAKQMGIERLERVVPRPIFDPPIIQSQIDGAPPGYHRIMLSEILRIAGIPVDDGFKDAVSYTSYVPRNRAEATDLLRNMTITVPPGSTG